MPFQHAADSFWQSLPSDLRPSQYKWHAPSGMHRQHHEARHYHQKFAHKEKVRSPGCFEPMPNAGAYACDHARTQRHCRLRWPSTAFVGFCSHAQAQGPLAQNALWPQPIRSVSFVYRIRSAHPGRRAGTAQVLRYLHYRNPVCTAPCQDDHLAPHNQTGMTMALIHSMLLQDQRWSSARRPYRSHARQ